MVTEEKYDVVYRFKKNLDDNRNSYLELIQLFHKLNTGSNYDILLDFSDVTFVSGNLLALFGCCLDNAAVKREHRIFFANLHKKIKTVMQKNGFHKHFSWEKIDDTHHSTIAYTIYEASTAHLEDFERYLFLHVFSREELPSMESSFRDRIIDNFLEIFNNVIDHADTERVFTCGQYFPKTDKLIFSIVDSGRTIEENVTKFLKKYNQEIPDNTLQWAVEPGNSTKADTAPGGLGFYFLIEFIRMNKGGFTVISGKEIYEINKTKERFAKMDTDFPGTIVTVTINLKDDQLYLLDTHNQNNMIVF